MSKLSKKEAERLTERIKEGESCGLIDSDDGHKITWNLITTKNHDKRDTA